MLLNRPLLFVGVLGAAVAVPYVLLDKNLSQTARTQFDRISGRVRSVGGAAAEANPLATGTGGQPTVDAIPPPAAMEEVFRFEITPQWVTSRWPRVSTAPGGLDQLGMRVAYASGTHSDDVAGSLTYYFNKHHQLERITFTGITGDHRRLMALLVSGYKLKSQPTTGIANYIAGDPQQPTSQVTVRHLPVVVAAADQARAEVAVDLRRDDLLNHAAPQEDPETDRKFLPTSYRRW
jgi:hypothetical protein